MAELDVRSSPWNEGLGIPGEFLDHQLYLLGCIVHASTAFDSLGSHALLDLRQRFQEPEIGRLLLTVAIAVRNGMDQNPARTESLLDDVEHNVGTLRTCKESEAGSLLGIREACNKLIHCHSINFHYVAERPRRGTALVPLVHLYGWKGKEEWKATIDVTRFIAVASYLT